MRTAVWIKGEQAFLNTGCKAASSDLQLTCAFSPAAPVSSLTPPPTTPPPTHHRTGLNNNSYQISRGLFHNNRAGHGITDTCNFVKADFMRMPFGDATYDAVYEIDATCHAPDQVGWGGWVGGRRGVYREQGASEGVWFG